MPTSGNLTISFQSNDRFTLNKLILFPIFGLKRIQGLNFKFEEKGQLYVKICLHFLVPPFCEILANEFVVSKKGIAYYSGGITTIPEANQLFSFFQIIYFYFLNDPTDLEKQTLKTIPGIIQAALGCDRGDFGRTTSPWRLSKFVKTIFFYIDLNISTLITGSFLLIKYHTCDGKKLYNLIQVFNYVKKRQLIFNLTSKYSLNYYFYLIFFNFKKFFTNLFREDQLRQRSVHLQLLLLYLI